MLLLTVRLYLDGEVVVLQADGVDVLAHLDLLGQDEERDVVPKRARVEFL